MINRLLSPIHSLTAHRIRRKQMRMALQMLAVSGVIRPSHVELRYETPIIRVGTLRTTATIDMKPITNDVSQAREQTHGQVGTPVAQWVRTLPTAIAHLARKPIGLQWNTD